MPMITRQASRNSIELAALLLILVLSVLIYKPGLDGPLLLDDYPRLGGLLVDRQLGIDELSEQMAENPATLKRPISILSFVGNHLYNGNNLFAWKLTNLLLHLICGVVIFCFLKIIEKILSLISGINCSYLALVVTTVWLLHPIQVSTTLYLVQRMAQLSAVFVGLGLCSYAIGRLRQIRGQPGKLYLWLSVLLFLPLAIFSKENGIILLPLILVTEISLFRFGASPLLRTELNRFLVTGILLPIAIGAALLIGLFDTLVIQGYQGRTFSLGERLLTELRVVCMYIGQILWPAPSSMSFFYENYPVSESLFKPVTTALSLIIILVMLVFSWLARHRMPLLTFGILFYFVSISIESSIFPLELAFEHRNYLGLLGISVAGYSLVTHIVSKSVIRYILYVLVVALLVTATASRAGIWSSKTSLYNYYYRINPDSPRIVSMIAEELTKQERYDQALRLLAGVSANGARLQSFYIRCLRGDNLQDIDYQGLAEKVTSPIDNYAITGIIEIANLGLDEQCNMSQAGYERFLSEVLSRTYRGDDNKFKIEMYHAHYLWQLGKKDEAFALLEAIATGEYSSPVPLFLAAEWALETGNTALAADYLNRAEQLAEGEYKDYSDYSDSIRDRLGSGKRRD